MVYENALIVRATAGFYYCKTTDGEILECRARGVLRKRGIAPLVGDYVTASLDGELGTVDSVNERRNSFLRPPVANIDRLIIVASLMQPRPSVLLIDRLTAIAVSKKVEPVVVLTKTDLAPCDDLRAVYEGAKIKCVPFCALTGEGADAVRELFNGCVCALTGNTGAGKSTLLNCIAPELGLETGSVSKKLGRGRHTTRTVELYELCGGYIADTPGFSSLDFESGERILKDELPECFPEFEPYLGKCRFISCSHVCEKGCAVCEAVERGEIPKSRHESYKTLYGEVRDYRQWQDKK